MAQQVGQYTLSRKAKISVADGSVTIVFTLVETSSGRLILDNVPTNLAPTIQANLAAIAGQYDYIGS